jgi:hypothetical protein
MARSKGFPGVLGVLADDGTPKLANAPEPRPKAAAPGDGSAAPGVVADGVGLLKPDPSPTLLENDTLRPGVSFEPFRPLFGVERESLLLLEGKAY